MMMKSQNELWLWVRTQLVDYACCGTVALIGWALLHYGSNGAGSDSTCTTGMMPLMGLFARNAFFGFLYIGLVYFRERIHFKLLGDLVPKSKRRNITRHDFCYALQAILLSIIVSSGIEYNGYAYGEIDKFGNDNGIAWFLLTEVYAPFFALLLLRDIFLMAPFHTLMHTKYFYKWHKEHHKIGLDAQALHTFRLDVVDLFIENAGAPALLLAIQSMTGRHVGFHVLAIFLFLFHDGAVHSVNPYSAMYFVPVLDYFLKPNICHQLHHAVPHKGYTLGFPYHHLIPSKRQHDIDYYNKSFGTNYYSQLFGACKED